MDFGALLRRAWDIIWDHKWLVLLGVIIAIGSGSGAPGSGFPGNGGSGYQFSNGDFSWDQGDPAAPDFDFRDFEQNLDRDFEDIFPYLGIGLAILIPLICLGVLIGVAFWAAALIARGGLIAAVDQIDGGGSSSFGDAWRAGWAKGWRLIGAGLIPAIPGLVAAIVVIALVAGFIGAASTINEMLGAVGAGMLITLITLCCITFLVSLVLGLLHTFAERAVMLEDLGVFEAYGRGWEVIKTNAGPALILWLIQVGISIGLGIILVAPSIFMALCCLLWPVLWLINGAIETYFSTLWTLGYREWTGRSGPSGEPVGEPVPAV